MTLCECGCGETTNINIHKKGKPSYRFIKGHGNIGRKFSPMAKINMSKSHKGKKHTNRTKNKMSKTRKGKKLSPEHIAKLIGLKCSQETKNKMSKAKMGKKCSQETKDKMSKVNLGKKLSQETKDKMIKARTGFKHSPETRAKMSKNNKGKKLSHETRAKISKNSKGEKCHFYIDGRHGKQKYCWKFSPSLKRKVRKNFNNICVECGKLESDCKTKLCIHHVNYDKNTCCEGEKSTVAPLFVPLCQSCHGKTNNKSKRDFYEEKYTKLIMEEYNGVCF